MTPGPRVHVSLARRQVHHAIEYLRTFSIFASVAPGVREASPPHCGPALYRMHIMVLLYTACTLWCCSIPHAHCGAALSSEGLHLMTLHGVQDIAKHAEVKVCQHGEIVILKGVLPLTAAPCCVHHEWALAWLQPGRTQTFHASCSSGWAGLGWSWLVLAAC